MTDASAAGTGQSADTAAPVRVVAVIGPTGVGKTEVGEGLARRLGGEIVSADSMQVYRGMDVGTAKQPLERRTVPYHCLDLADPGEPFSAALYQRAARAAIDDILSRGRTPVLVGGTGLYVRAALDEMEFPRGESASPDRVRLERMAGELGPVGLHEHLRSLDAKAAALIHPNNTRRVLRAIEMLETGGVSYADQAERFRERVPHHRTAYVGLTMDRTALYERIGTRVDAMLAAGLLAEVERLLVAGYRDAVTAAQAIGYKELVPVLEEGADLQTAVHDIKQATRRYAKRQMTWFRADPRVRWLDVTGLSPDAAADAATALVESETSD